MIGETISHYRITEKLGEGGMGVVYLAEDITLGRLVAIKFLSSTAKEYRARFLREARAVSALTHPNIAAVFDYGETADGEPYIVMEFIKGEPLSDKLLEGSLPLPEAVRIISLIGEALGEAHHIGVVHRDVKPSNVVITERGQVKVLDFGLVKQLAEQHSLGGDPNLPTLPFTRTRSDVIVGTPMYLSPEQATGKKVDARSDLFALGVVLYECITGQAAFSGSSVFDIGAQVIHGTPSLPSSINSRVPRALDRITMKAIAKKPENRYQSAPELIEDLKKVLPTLQTDGYRQVRATDSALRPRTYSASALTTIAETLRRPGPSLGKLIIGVLLVAAALVGLIVWQRPAPYKPIPEAKAFYDKGLDALRNGAFLQATKAFEQALAKEPKFPLAHARLAEAWNELDYADNAKDEMLKVQQLVPNRSQLDKTDRLYLDAITATIARDYPTAINSYKELVRLAPNDPQVYVDLGRAYEKDDQIEDAIKNYVEATARSGTYGTAFLLVGTLYARKVDQPGAAAAFDKAEAIYQAEGNFEGQGEVSFQRGFLFDKLGKATEARQQLQHALDLARTTGNDYLNAKTLFKLGDIEPTTEGARKYMNAALASAQEKGIDNLVKRGLADIGNTYLRDGNYAEAEKYFNESLSMARKQHDERNKARALLCLASSADRQGNTALVLKYVNEALPFYQKGGYRKETIQALALLARTQVHQGEYQAAMAGYQQGVKVAQELGDPTQTMTARLDLARLLIREGKYPEAIQQLDISYQIAKSLDVPKNVALTLIDRANAWWRLGNYSQAESLLDEAAPIALKPDAAINLVAFYNVSKARMKLSQQQLSEAEAYATKGLRVAVPNLKGAAIEGEFTMCSLQTFSGNARQGKPNCQLAVDEARASGDPDLISLALLALAHNLAAGGEADAALGNALEAQQLFARSGSKDNEWIAWTIAAVASRKSDPGKAHDYASRAQQVLLSIEAQWGSDHYNAFLKRPDIQTFRKQLDEVMAGKT
jgi:tetratricopeptide (TPR) repeat protein/predicted Ser/Thr protein kinase